jgi:uncharacterized membrane protein YphA (DoxX/SURF4 family)
MSVATPSLTTSRAAVGSVRNLTAGLVPLGRAFFAAIFLMAQIQFAMFMKNLGLLGGALLVAHLGAGPYSVDTRREATRSAR